MSYRIDYERINVVDFLERLSIRNVRDEGREVFYSCPFAGHNNDDTTPSASMQQGTTKAYCFACGWRGNALRFLSDFEGVSPIVAARWIREEYGDSFKEPETTFADEMMELTADKMIPERHIPRYIEEHEITRRIIDWAGDSPPAVYMRERGFEPDTLDIFDVGFDFLSQRISIPYRTADGGILGFKGRALPGEEPRYKALGGPEYGFDTFQTSSHLYGLYQAIRSEPYQVRHHLIVREGELNVIAVAQAGFENVVGLSGKFLGKEQVELIKRHAASADFWFDTQEDTDEAVNKLVNYMPVRSIVTHKDPADMSRSEISSAIFSPVRWADLLY